MKLGKLGLIATLILFIFINDIKPQSGLDIYGYFSARVEKIFSVPVYENGEVESEDEDWEWQYPYLNLMFQNQPAEKLKFFLNLNAGGKNELQRIDIRNVWAEYEVSNFLKLRVGKSYRKFDLFNEILDAVPTYYGIEPPQFLNQEHPITLLCPRTTSLLVQGALESETGNFSYGLSIDKGFDETFREAFPMSLDISYNFFTDFGSVKFGVSGYKTFGDVIIEEEEESESELAFEGFENGTLSWMERDNFNVYGAYIESHIDALTIQGGLWKSDHESERNLEILEEMLLAKDNPAHVARYLLDPESPIEEDNLIKDVDYSIDTWYLRFGYSFYTSIGEMGPYLQYDYYKNPELVALGSMDREHNGIPDEGKFQVITAGLLYRPVPQTAIKLDISNHRYNFYGEEVSYPEFKLDFSFLFGEIL